MTGALARQNAVRNPKRTGASASALMIGVGVVAFITVLTSSTAASINSTIDRSFAGDVVIDSAGGLSGGVDPALAGQLNKLPQVAVATGLGIGVGEIFARVEQFSSVDPATAGKIFDVKPLHGSVAALGRTGIAVYSTVAAAHYLRVGSTVPVLFKDTGLQRLRVALSYGVVAAILPSRRAAKLNILRAIVSE